MRQIGICRIKSSAYITDEEKLSCGLNIGEKGYNLSPIATVGPLIDYRNEGNLGGTVISMSPASHKTCKPIGQDGIIICFGFYKANATIPIESKCTHTILLTKSYGKVVFPDKKRGKCFVGYARYYNTRNIVGLLATVFYGTVC